MKIERPNRKKEQGTETKRKLYESADRLFGKNNYVDVSVEAIAEAAGVTKGTFYVHFDSKDALYISLFTDYVAHLDLDYRAFLDSLPPNMPASDILMSFVNDIIDVMMDRVGYDKLRTVYALQLTNMTGMETISGYGRELYKMFSDVLEQGIQRGEFKTSLPLETLARHFVMAIRGLTYEWCIRNHDFDLREQALTHFKLLLDGIAVNIS